MPRLKLSLQIQNAAKVLNKRPCRITLEEINGRVAICILKHNIIGKSIRGIPDDLDVDEMEAVLKGMGVKAERIRLIKNKLYGNNIGVYVFVEDLPPDIALQGFKPALSSTDLSYEKTTRQQERRRFRQAYAKSVAQARKSTTTNNEKPQSFRQAYTKSVAQAGRHRKELDASQ